MDWGQPPKDPKNPGPNEFNTVHSIAISKRPPAVRRRSRPSAHAGVRRERQVPRHVAAAFTALAEQPGHPDGESHHRPEGVHLGGRRADQPDPEVRSERQLSSIAGARPARSPGGSAARTGCRRISSAICTSPIVSPAACRSSSRLPAPIRRRWRDRFCGPGTPGRPTRSQEAPPRTAEKCEAGAASPR